MILLRRLRVPALKQLRDVDIWFPRYGSILIEGQNEAGKSTIFEAIYFALYGAALVGEKLRATLDDLIPHDATTARVELIIAVGETSQTTLEIHRSLALSTDGRRRTQQARLVIRRSGAHTEELNGASAVNDRILQELSGLDGDALRNSCFMEQKALDRVEALSRDQREAAVAKLLGLERLSRIERELEKACKEHAQRVESARRVAQVAELRAKAAGRARDVAEAERRLRAARVLALVAERDSDQSGRGGVWTDERRSAVLAQQAALQARIERDQTVTDLLNRIESQGAPLAELQAIQAQQRRDQNDLDGLAQVATGTQMLHTRLDALRAAEITMRDVALARAGLRQACDVHAAQDEAMQARTARDEARQNAQVAARATARETLTRWIKLKDVETVMRDGDANVAVLSKQRAADTADRENARGAASRLLALAVLGGAVALVIAAAGITWHPLWALACLFAGASGLLAWRWTNARGRVADAERRLALSSERLTEARATRETAQNLAGGLDELLRGETLLRDAGLQAPATVEEARSLLATLSASAETAPRGGDAHAAQAAQAAAHLVSQRESELAAALARLHEAQQAYQTYLGSDNAPNGDITPEHVAALREALQHSEAELQRQLAALGLIQQSEPQRHVEQTEQTWQRLIAVALGEAEATVRQLRERLALRDPLTQRIADQSTALEQRCVALAEAVASLWREAEELAVVATDAPDEPRSTTTPPAAASQPSPSPRLGTSWRSAAQPPGAVSSDRPPALDAQPAPDGRSDPATLTTTYERLREAVLAERDRLDAARARVELAALEATLTERARAHGEQQTTSETTKARRATAVRELLREQGLACQGDEPLASLRTLWPLLGEVEAGTMPAWEAELQRLRNEAHHLRESASEHAQTLGIAEDDALDVVACQEQLAGAEASLRRHELALKLAEEVRARIVRRVLPETEIFMRRLLPALTAGRYRDARLLAEEGNGADLHIALWDELAGRHVAKNLFSGGTRDQCSLALRLAFALATLPKELGALPGFIFLDEPLSSFDAERSHALVEVLTQGEIARQFAQVMLISHSQSFERESFRYHVRMTGGRVAASNLPDEQAAHALWHGESPERASLPTLPAV